MSNTEMGPGRRTEKGPELGKLIPAPTPATVIANALKEIRDLTVELGKIKTTELRKAEKVISMLHKVDPQIFAALPNEANAIYKWCFEAVVREGQTRSFGDRREGRPDMTAVMGLQLAANILNVCNRSVEVSGLGEFRKQALAVARAEQSAVPLSAGHAVINQDGLAICDNPAGAQKSNSPLVSPSVIDSSAGWRPDHIGMIGTMLQQQSHIPEVFNAGIELVKGLSPIEFHRFATTEASLGVANRANWISTIQIIDRTIDLCDVKLGANSTHTEGTKAFLQTALATFAYDSASTPGEVRDAAREVLKRRGLSHQLTKEIVDTALAYVGSQEHRTIMGGTHHAFYNNPVVAHYYTDRADIFAKVNPPYAN